MPLVRKPPRDRSPAAAAPTCANIAEALASCSEDERWTAARAAAGVPGCASTMAAALQVEASPRVREALFTSLSRTADPASVAALQSLLRSDDAALRTGALDALRLVVPRVRGVLQPLLQDQDVDVRILSCELARLLPGDEATLLLSRLLRSETEPNVCAAAIDVLAEVGHDDALAVLAECAARFRGTPFLSFAIQVAIDRISAQTCRPRA